ncbi:CoA transferase [Planktotalea sp.]|uniref:CoA transferase n=1 Tax=Planktotalea sp. TaxID=2029877 RepID=UPI0035C7C528
MHESNPFWNELCDGVFGERIAPYRLTGAGHLPSYFRTTDLAEASIGLAGVALARLGVGETVSVNQRRAALWFDMTLRPVGWEADSLWDAVAGNYQCKDGWIRLHTNAPHHRDAALSVLKVAADRDLVAGAVLDWNGEALEKAIVAANGCAAFMRTAKEWRAHPQGQALARDPLVQWQVCGDCAPRAATLKGLKVLDLTRVLAGPVATRVLAGFGANVLRIDPPSWNEPSVEMEVTLGKRCAGLDLRKSDDLARLKTLLQDADVFVHGYRADALERLGLGAEVRRALNPEMIDVSLNAYGWSGPWVGRRGFDSLVQMSCGIAATGMAESGANKPVPLPVQALDHATGYLMAACVLEALKARSEGVLKSAKVSLARTALLLMKEPCAFVSEGAIVQSAADFSDGIEVTGWGDAQRVKLPLRNDGKLPEWPIAAGPLRRHEAVWREQSDLFSNKPEGSFL